jgi:putative spermidine/putrescine transport system substrate-binding protein
MQLHEKGALEKFDRKRFSRTKLDDIDPATIGEAWIGNIDFSTVLGYNTEHFRAGHPTSWAEFWDVKKFPGARTLEDLAAGVINLEFALLADGVSKEKIYPIDMDRAFHKLKEIKKHIVKWWDTGAISAQLFTDKEVVAGSIWNGRIQIPIEAGAPLAIEWNEAMLQQQIYCIVKGAPNLDNAYKYIDFALQAERQAEFAKFIPYGPSNEKAYTLLSNELKAKLPGSPEHKAKAFRQNVRWWIGNKDKVAERWQEFLLSG